MNSDFNDIYYIILDGYANNNSLKKYINYDNRNFIKYLKDIGFFVVSDGRSNYPSTIFSLPTTLNMEYINYKKIGSYEKIQYIWDNNKLFKYLKNKNYKIINIEKLDDNYGDIKINKNKCKADSGEFVEILLKTTILYPFLNEYYNFYARSNILCYFKNIIQIIKVNGPKFVYAYIPSPHPPYLFGRNGEKVITESSSINWETKTQYLDQLIYITKKIKEIITIILNNNNNTIIIIQSDHGPHFSVGNNVKKQYDLQTGIINAFYLPNKKHTRLYNTMTPVNTFRIIMNLYFGENLKYLDDKIYDIEFSKKYSDLVFVNITDYFNE